ncbi:MAG: hypothetical protein AABY53_06220 [Bdellovibrionota bacterium]
MKHRYLLLSALIHILISGLTFLRFNVINIPKTEVIEVEFKEIINADKVRGSKQSKPRSVNSNIKKIELFPRTRAASLLARVEENAEAAKTPDVFGLKSHFNDSKTYDKDISEIFGDNGNQNWSYYKEVYNRIDSSLMFDSILAQYNHFGKVFVQFKVDSDGLLIVDGLKTDAADAILKVHVLRAIKKSLSEPIELVKKSKLNQYTLFNAVFDFRFGDPRRNFLKQEAFGKPVFVFRRNTLERPVDKKLLSYLLDQGVVDNPFLIAERLKKYNKKKYLEDIQFDPFENYRRDVFYLM